MQHLRKGKIIPNGVSLEKHEYDTILFLTMIGNDIELIPPSNTPGVRTPDFKMNGVEWEMKSPNGNSRSTIEHAFQIASHQSQNIIIDLRRTKIPDSRALHLLGKLMKTSRRAKRLGVVSKEQKLLWSGIDF